MVISIIIIPEKSVRVNTKITPPKFLREITAAEEKNLVGSQTFYLSVTTKFKNESQALGSSCGLHGLVTNLKASAFLSAC